MEKKNYKASYIKDLLVEFASLIETLKGDFASPRSLERGLLAISLLSSWITTLYSDGYPYLFSEVLRRVISIENDDQSKENYIKHVCAELNRLLFKYRDQSITVNRAVTKVIVSHKLTMDFESMLGDNLAIIHLLEKNVNIKAQVNEVIDVEQSGDVEAVKRCGQYVKIAQEEIIPELYPLVETLNQYFSSIFVTEMDEVEYTGGPATVLFSISPN